MRASSVLTVVGLAMLCAAISGIARVAGGGVVKSASRRPAKTSAGL